MSATELERLGFTPEVASHFAPFAAEGLQPGRVLTSHQRLLRVGTAWGELLAEIAGSLRHAARGNEDLPATGDWVALRLSDAAALPRGDERAVIEAVLRRRTVFVRRAAGDPTLAQVLAANVDTAFLVMGLDANYNLRRLERVLVLTWESGAAPVIVLNKADVGTELEGRRREIERIAPGVPLCVVAAKPGLGLDSLAPWLLPGRTVVLLGSSGVGKSTIVNRLLGVERQKTQDVRAGDERGRHTTSQRELIALPGGALLIDTPGLREIQLWSEGRGLDAAFEDVAALSASCRFSDCSHVAEPGCAVREAAEEGRLDPARLESFLKLKAELRALEIREDPLRRRQERSRWKAIHKSMRKDPKRD